MRSLSSLCLACSALYFSTLPLIGFALLFSLAVEKLVFSARLKVALTFFVPTSLFIVMLEVQRSGVMS